MPDVGQRARFLINSNYRRLWVGFAVSVVGDLVFDTTLTLWLATQLLRDRPWAPAAVSGLLLAAALPALLLGPVAGVFVDRWDYRRTMLVADAARAVLVGGMVVLPLLPAGTLPVPAALVIVYAAVAAASVFAQFFNPARFALIGDIVEPDDRARASSISQATYGVAGVIGPPLAAPVLFVFGVHWALLVNAASFVVSFIAVRSVRVPPVRSAGAPAARASFRRELADGLRFFGHRRELVVLLVSASLVTVGAAATNVLDVFFLRENLHAPASAFGTMAMCFSAGSVLGALLAAQVSGRLGLDRTYWLGLLLAGAGFVVFARSVSLGVALVLLALMGVPIALVNSIVGPIVLRVTPRELVGRTISVITPTLQLASLLAISAAGFLVSTVLSDFHAEVAGVRFGRIDTVYTVGGLLIMASALWASAALRSDQPSDRVAAPGPGAG